MCTAMYMALIASYTTISPLFQTQHLSCRLFQIQYLLLADKMVQQLRLPSVRTFACYFCGNAHGFPLGSPVSFQYHKIYQWVNRLRANANAMNWRPIQSTFLPQTVLIHAAIFTNQWISSLCFCLQHLTGSWELWPSTYWWFTSSNSFQ